MSNNIDEQIKFVKEQAAYQADKAHFYAKSNDLSRSNQYEKRKETFSRIARSLASIRSIDSPLYVTPDDLIGLPEELIQALNLTESDKKDFYLLNLIKKLGGKIGLDKLMIAIYRDSGEIYDRTKLMARLYRMSVKGLIYTHPSKKGQYSLQPWEIDEQNDEETEEE